MAESFEFDFDKLTQQDIRDLSDPTTGMPTLLDILDRLIVGGIMKRPAKELARIVTAAVPAIKAFILRQADEIRAATQSEDEKNIDDRIAAADEKIESIKAEQDAIMRAIRMRDNFRWN